MTERRESEEISRAARRMAEAAEELSRSVDRLTEREAVALRVASFWESIEGALQEGSLIGLPSISAEGPIHVVTVVPSLSEEEAALLAVQTVREVREELWGEREAEAPAPDEEDIARWVSQREARREMEDYRPS